MADITEFIGEHFWLSNFYPSPVVLDDKVYPSVEHAYQAAKTLDITWREMIRGAKKAGQAKRMGRQVKIRAKWDLIKEGIMLELLRSKFGSLELRQKLIDTGDSRLVEGNYWGDIYWGVSRQIGKNRLGELLMQVRMEILTSSGR